MSEHVVAIPTYGSQRVNDPSTNKRVSAYKIGYSSAASAVLLALFGEQARNVSSTRASYHYIHIDADVTVRHGYIVLKVNDHELGQAQIISRRYQRAGVHRWQDGRWYEFPDQHNADYMPATYGGPSFNPSGLRPLSPSSGECEAAVEGIVVEKSQRDPNDKAWFWLTGDTYPHRELLKRAGCRWSNKRKAWYFVGWELPESVQRLIAEHAAIVPSDAPVDDDAPCSDAEAERILGVKLFPKPAPVPVPFTSASEKLPTIDTSSTSDEPDEAQVETSQVRVIPPVVLPSDGEPLDDIQTAIAQAKAQPFSVSAASTSLNQKRSLAAIGQAYCGELTGDVSSNVHCFGYAVHDGVLIYLNMGGPRSGVEAVRAKLSKGMIVNLTPWDAPAIELTAVEGNTGMYTDYTQNISEAKYMSMILLHEQVITPNYGGKSTTFIFRTSDEQAMAKLKHHVMQLVKVPVFDEWASYLYHAGQTAMLVRKTRSGGDIDLLTIDLDVDAWTRLLTGGLAQAVITLP